ncbi:RDD family protein [Treponema sp. OMZ 840]|uniref:RDD family protein n=1 Tax=Treponema sp. OMZ 840 TaxID=244313 RepID=UPI003D8BB344
MNGKRALAFFIDFLITAIIQNFLFMYFIIYPLAAGTAQEAGSIFFKALLITYGSMCYMIFRDVPKGGGIGKHIAKLQIVCAATRDAAPLSKRLLRNVFWVSGPLELFIYAVTGKKLGGRIAGTDIALK